MQIEEMRLDGNAAAGVMREIFAQDMTVAVATCAGCGKPHKIGTLLEYGHAMGVILRCPGCDMAMLRFARTEGSMRLDASGMTYLMIPD